MSKVNPKFHVNLFKTNSTELTFFKDVSLEIETEFIYKNNKIEKINFQVSSHSSRHYKILDINPCYDMYDNKITHYIVHFQYADDNSVPKNSKFEADISKHIPKIDLTASNKVVFFRFSFHTTKTYTDKCSISEEQPDTKDGAVIVSI